MSFSLQEFVALAPIPDEQGMAVVSGNAGQLAAARGETQCLDASVSIPTGGSEIILLME